MAITKIIKVKGNEKACIRYVTNKDKTNDGQLVSYSGCTSMTASYNFKAALDMNSRTATNGESIRAYHFIQSFAKTDQISAEDAHRIGLELMDKLLGDKYAFICATHNDRGHLHNHMVVCAARRDMTGRKLDDNLALLHELQNINDRLCHENGLDVVMRKRSKGKRYNEWMADQTNPTGSKKQQLRDLIDEQIKHSRDFDDFIENMKNAGADIAFGNSKKYGRVTKYRLPGAGDKDKWHRGYNLGPGYSDEIITRRIENRMKFKKDLAERKAQAAEKRKAERAAMTPAEKTLDRGKLKIRNMVDTSKMDVTASDYRKKSWYERQNAMRTEKIKEELKNRFGISYTDISGKINELAADITRLQQEIEETKKSLPQLRNLIESCRIYMDTFPVNRRYEHSKDPEKYYEEHDEVLNAFNDSEYFLGRAGVDTSLLQDRETGRKYIEILQKRLLASEDTIQAQERQIKKNEHHLAELRKYQKELDIYHGRKDHLS